MKQRKHPVWVRLVLLMLSVALLMSIAPDSVVIPGQAVTQAEIDELREDSKELSTQRKDLQNQIAALRSNKNALLEQKQLIEQEMSVIQEEINNLARQIVLYEQMIAEKEVAILAAQEEERVQYELFCERVRYMEEDGQVNYWAILFNSSDFSDLLDRFMMVEEIMEYDNEVMNNLIAIRERIEADKAELEQAKGEKETAKTEQENNKKELVSQQGKVDSLITEINAEATQLQQAEDALRAEADKMNAIIAQKEQALLAQLAAEGGTIVSEANFIWPISSSVSHHNWISSFFGSRIHPVTGKPNNHTGIDIPVAGGTSILSAKSGIVLTSGYNSSYGNYVVVSHGEGLSTLYAHMRSRAVAEGDKVTQGQTLGYVGTTGSSTGNHLHYEIRVNGNRLDPLTYYRGSTLYAYSGGRTQLIDWSNY